MGPDKLAYDITTPMIQATGAAMASGDFDAFMRYFALPFVLETFEGKHLFRTRREFKAHFDGVRRFRVENAIVDSKRENVSAEFHDDETIALIHVSHLYQEGGVLFDRPYPTYSVIRKVNGRWLTQYSQYAVGDMDAFTRALLKFKEDPSPCDGFS